MKRTKNLYMLWLILLATGTILFGLTSMNANAQTLVEADSGFVFTLSDPIVNDGFEFRYIDTYRWDLDLSKTLRAESYSALMEKVNALVRKNDVYTQIEVRMNDRKERFQYEATLRVAKLEEVDTLNQRRSS